MKPRRLQSDTMVSMRLSGADGVAIRAGELARRRRRGQRGDCRRPERANPRAVERDLDVSRRTATKYLAELGAAGFGRKGKVGRTNFYLNEPLLKLLAT